MTSRDEQNRKLAAWIESCPGENYNGGSYYNDFQYSPAKAWHRMHMLVVKKHWQPRDFFTDESANAMLLEKMGDPLLSRENGQWECDPTSRDMKLVGLDPDRKTAICLAALAMIEKEQR